MQLKQIITWTVQSTCALIASLLLLPHAGHTNTFWAAGVGDWSNPANWTNVTPTLDTSLTTIDNGGTARITTRNRTASAQSTPSNQLSAASTGNSITLDGEVASISSVRVGGNGSESLLIKNGGMLTSLQTAIHSTSLDVEANAIVQDVGSSWTNTGTFAVRGNGSLIVERSAIVAIQHGTIQGDSVGDARVTVRDAGSSVSFENRLFINGTQGNIGQLLVSDNAELTVGSNGDGIVELGSSLIATSLTPVAELHLGVGNAAGTLHARFIRGGLNGGLVIFNHDHGVVELEPTLLGNVGFRHDGLGTTRISGVNNYDQASRITNGTLIFEGEQRGEGEFVLSSGATLNAEGSINGRLLVSGTLDVGVDIGTLELRNNLHASLDSLTTFDLTGTTPGIEFDQIILGGTAFLNGYLNVNLPSTQFLEPDQEFKLIDIDGLRLGTFQGLDENDVVGTYNGLELRITYKGGDGNDVVLYTQNRVPEPSTLTLIAMILIARRRHRLADSTPPRPNRGWRRGWRGWGEGCV